MRATGTFCPLSDLNLSSRGLSFAHLGGGNADGFGSGRRLCLRDLVCEELQAAGFSVVEVGDADAAILILEARDDIHLVFTDIDMPGSMDGLKLAAAVRDRWPPVSHRHHHRQSQTDGDPG